LYNALPNVFVVFTMTLGLRDKLYGRMEGQFQDRVRRDARFVLHDIEGAEVLALYRQRVQTWLADAPPGLWDQVVAAGNAFLPFDQAAVLTMARQRTLRDTLREFDRQFRGKMYDIHLKDDPVYDCKVIQKEFRAEEHGASAYQYTESILDLIHDLLRAPDVLTGLADAPGLKIDGIERVKTDDGAKALRIVVRDAADDRLWVRVFLARLGFLVSNPLPGYLRLVANKWVLNNQLWVVRATPVSADARDQFPPNGHFRVHSAATHTDWRALLHTLRNRDQYRPDAWAAFLAGAWADLSKTWLGDLFREVRVAVEQQKQKAQPADADGADDTRPDHDPPVDAAAVLHTAAGGP
jgi:hypothetical protein